MAELETDWWSGAGARSWRFTHATHSLLGLNFLLMMVNAIHLHNLEVHDVLRSDTKVHSQFVKCICPL